NGLEVVSTTPGPAISKPAKNRIAKKNTRIFMAERLRHARRAFGVEWIAAPHPEPQNSPGRSAPVFAGPRQTGTREHPLLGIRKSPPHFRLPCPRRRARQPAQ